MTATTMTQEARISTRIDKDLKTEAESLLAELGMKPSQAISMFYKQIVRQRGYPFELKVPNAETIAAMNEDLSNSRRYESVEALMDDLHSDDNA